MRTSAKDTTKAPRTSFPYLCGAVGGPLFVIAFLIQGTVRPGYDPMRHPVSGYPSVLARPV